MPVTTHGDLCTMLWLPSQRTYPDGAEGSREFPAADKPIAMMDPSFVTVRNGVVLDGLLAACAFRPLASYCPQGLFRG